MKFRNRIIALLLLLSIVFSLSACQKATPADPLITLVDQAGRSVQLEKTAEQVVSCYYVSTYAMLSLGLKDELVGIEKKAETRPIYKMVDPAIIDLPAVGTMKEINIEKIASLSPDLVILPKKQLESAAALEELGIPAIVVNPETDDDLREMLTLIGTACGAEKQANDLISYYDEKLSGFSPEGETPSVLCCGNGSYLEAAPSGMYQNDLIALAGGKNAFAESEETYWEEISYETILKLDPDYIVIPAGATYTAEDMASDSVLADLRAVKENHIVTVPGTFEEWDSPIPSAVLGILWLRAVLHPSDYTPESFRKDTADFYETFYGFTPDAEALSSLG